MISEPPAQGRVSVLTGEIADVYAASTEGVTVATAPAGPIIFWADPIRELPMRMTVGLVWVSSQARSMTVPRGLAFESASLPLPGSRGVLLFDAMLDTGGTLRLVQGEVRRAEPRSVRAVDRLHKAARASPEVAVVLFGVDIRNAFVVRNGLDYNGRYSDPPQIAALDAAAGRDGLVS